MSSIEMSASTFVLVFGGALLGQFIRRRLPEHHQNADTKDVVRLGMGLVGTIVAIALGLLIGSAYSYFNNQTDELVHVSADVGTLGRLLRHYGPEANGVHEALRTAVERALKNALPQQTPIAKSGSKRMTKLGSSSKLFRTREPHRLFCTSLRSFSLT